MHRFLVEHPLESGCAIPLSEAEAAHAARVLRLKAGDQVQLSDGRGQLWAGLLTEVSDGGGVWAKPIERLLGNEPPVRVTLFQGYPKADKLEWIVQKATELGVARIVPVMTRRTVVKLKPGDGEKKRDRLAKIAQEAAKQCGRAVVPEILAPVEFCVALEAMRALPLLLMPWEDARDVRIGDLLGAPEIGLFIGPEGGIDQLEAEAARGAGAVPVTLGPRILRTETAALAALSAIMHRWGDM